MNWLTEQGRRQVLMLLPSQFMATVVKVFMLRQSATTLQGVSPRKSRLVTTAYVLTLIGAGIAIVDIVVDTYFLTVTMAGHADTTTYVLIGLRVLCYLGLVPLTIALARRVRSRGSARARAGLVALMCGYAIGNVANYVISEGVFVMVTMLQKLQDNDVGTWLTSVWAVSVISDALGLVLAVTIAVLLLCAKLNDTSIAPATVDSGPGSGTQ